LIGRSKIILIPLLGTLLLIGPSSITAQRATVLHSFGSIPDGANPHGGLVLVSNTLYGTTSAGGRALSGTLFRVGTDGTDFTNFYALGFNSPFDGATPYGGLTASADRLYGTTLGGGSANQGTVFQIRMDGTGFSTIKNLNLGDGFGPYAGLLLSGDKLYGTTYNGGTIGWGTVFSVNTDGSGFTNLHSFYASNAAGFGPRGRLILSNETLYGTGYLSSEPGYGGIFSVKTDGASFTNLFTFNGHYPSGANPQGALILVDDTLYGTTQYGGSSGRGAVFAIKTNGASFTVLHSFLGSDGANPCSGLTLSGQTLYGTTQNGGTSAGGTVFAVNTDGSRFLTLYNFNNPAGSPSGQTNSEGLYPEAELVLSGYSFYGTAPVGGNSGYGTVFSISMAPQLTIFASGTNVILRWPTNLAGFDYSGFVLQCARDITSPTRWTNASLNTVVINGSNMVTDCTSGTQKFYRLVQ